MTTNLTIHRLLDEAFEGIASTPSVQDLKEELRANLVARVQELEAGGVASSEAARKAFDELGDVRAIIDDAAAEPASPIPGVDGMARNRVPFKGAFVVRAALAPIIGTIGLVLAFLAGAEILPGGAAAAAALGGVFAILLGFVCADALQQETDSHYPMPRGRAIGYGTGLAILLAGVMAFALCWVGPWPLWAWLTAGGVLTVAGIGVLAGLGGTQTNRAKPWMRELEQAWMRTGTDGAGSPAAHGGNPWVGAAPGSRFTTNPNAAARFGIYTAVIWIVAITTAILLGIFVGWAWAALPVVGAIVTMLLLLTQMLFGPEKTAK